MSIRLRILLLAVLMLTILGLVSTAVAQQDTWTCGGPYEASVWSIAIDPTDSMHLHIGTMEDFIYESTNGGDSWLTVSIEGSPDVYRREEVRTVSIHPYGPDTMFIATGKGAFKSTGAGQTWSQMFPQWPNQMWNCAEINRADPPVLFLGTWGSAWRSTDNGRNWAQMGWLTGSVFIIKADPVRPNIIYAANNTTIPNASIWKSTDSGRIWQNVHHNLQRFNLDNPVYGRAIEVDPVNPDIIYFGRESGRRLDTDTILAKSTDGGESWIDVTPPGLHKYQINGIAVSPLDHNTVLVCTEGDGVKRSTNGGATWEECNNGIIGVNPRAQSLTADPRTGFIYLGWYAGGIYRSRDNGLNWEKISYNITGAQVTDISLNRRQPDSLFTATANGLYISIDGALNWRYLDLNFPDDVYSGVTSVEVDPYDPSYVYACGYGTFYHSSDCGATWRSSSQGGYSISEIIVIELDGGRRLFMGSDQGLFYSDDLGENWADCLGGLPSSIYVASIVASPADPLLVYVGDHDNQLYKSTDGGDSWQILPSPIGINDIACDPANPGILYIITGHGGGDEAHIFKSTDGGQSWAEISTGIPVESFPLFSGLAVNPLNNNNVLVWSSRKGIFQSHDGGGTWEGFNVGLETGHPLGSTLFDPIDTGRVFLGLWGGSVWSIERRDMTATVNNGNNTLPTAFASTCYPNPFNPQTTIEYTLPEAGPVKVEVFDILGQRVATLINETQEAGSHQIVWDAKEQSSGMYFYRINAGDRSDMKKMILLK